MSTLRLYGDTSGYNDIKVPAAADNSSINLGNLTSNNYIQAQGFGAGNVSNTYLTDTFASNTYFQDNSSTVHGLNLESNFSSGNKDFSGTETILTGTNFRNTGIGFSVGSISWNSSNGRVTVPESGAYIITYTLYENGSSNVRHRVSINGTFRHILHFPLSDNGNKTFTFLVNLNVNDYVEIKNDSYTGRGYIGQAHSFFSIHFIG